MPPVQVRSYNTGSGFQNKDIDPGDGRHGNFELSTYASFSVNSDVSGQIISIDTDQYSVLYFKNFTLEENWKIKPTGSQPLIIKVLGDMIINGEIDCSGADGVDLSTNINDTPSGGVGVCGGGSGGNGGSVSQIATNGSEGGASVSGGSAGPSTSVTMGQGGGGGGAYGDTGGGKDPKDGDDSTGGAGGPKGTHVIDDAFTEVGGGSGGGGGSVFSNSAVEDSAGGGGGAGGGVIDIVVLGDVTIGINGKVLANGGSGGGNNTGLRAGGGGGGGGGSISLFALGDIVNDGLIEAKLGAAGATNAANGGDGGAGGNGHTWVTDNDLVPAGAGTIDPISFLGVVGATRYKVGVFTAESASYDLLNSFPRLTSGSLSSNLVLGSTATVEVSLSDFDDFTADTWEEVASLTQSPARYFRYRVSHRQSK